jgi:hypothetical protein
MFAQLDKASEDENDDKTFWSEYDGYVGLGLIEDHYSMTIEDYKSATDCDPIFGHCKRTYYDPLLNGALSEK